MSREREERESMKSELFITRNICACFLIRLGRRESLPSGERERETNRKINKWRQRERKVQYIIHYKEYLCMVFFIRFGCGESRKSSMYTLKLRAPPSVPTLILPLEGQVTDEVMQNLQLTGNKKVKKFVPIIW